MKVYQLKTQRMELIDQVNEKYEQYQLDKKNEEIRKIEKERNFKIQQEKERKERELRAKQQAEERRKEEERKRKEAERIELERKRQRQEDKERRSALLRNAVFKPMTVEQISTEFDKAVGKEEEFVDYCRLGLKNVLPYPNAKILYFFNADGQQTTESVYLHIKGLSNILLICRTMETLFYIHLKDPIPTILPKKKDSNGNKQETYCKMKGVNVYFLYQKGELVKYPQKLKLAKGDSRIPIETVKFTETKAKMEFKDFFEITIGEGYWHDITFANKITFFDENDYEVPFNPNKKREAIKQFVACQLLDN